MLFDSYHCVSCIAKKSVYQIHQEFDELTDKALKALKPRSAIYEITDHQGLSIRINPSGRIIFQYRYRFNGKPVRVKLGTYPQMTLAAALGAHQEARTMLDHGIDPASCSNDDRPILDTGACRYTGRLLFRIRPPCPRVGMRKYWSNRECEGL